MKVFTFGILAVIVCTTQGAVQWAEVFDAIGSSGNNATIYDNCPDLRYCLSTSWDNKIRSACISGTWFFFDIANYGAGAAQWTWGLEKCFDLDFTTTSSMRYVGDSNNHNASTLSFYELESFRGGGATIQGNVPNIAGIEVNSIITTGEQFYTVYSESSYNGQSICLQPFPDLRPVFYNTVNSIGIPAVKSIAIGCYGDKVVRGFSPDKEGLFSFPIKQDN